MYINQETIITQIKMHICAQYWWKWKGAVCHKAILLKELELYCATLVEYICYICIYIYTVDVSSLRVWPHPQPYHSLCIQFLTNSSSCTLILTIMSEFKDLPNAGASIPPLPILNTPMKCFRCQDSHFVANNSCMIRTWECLHSGCLRSKSCCSVLFLPSFSSASSF